MKITWYGTASILLATENQNVMFDPYLKYLPEGREPQEMLDRRLNAFKNQKTVFITHGHFDHLGSVSKLYKDADCKIYLSKTPYARLVSEGVSREKLNEISPNQEICLPNGVTVRVFQGKHIKFEKLKLIKKSFSKRHLAHPLRKLRLTLEHLKYKENGETLFYEILAEGKRIQIMGSASVCDGVDYATGADVLVLPHQGRSDIDLTNEKIVNRLKPKRVVLDHYDDAFPPYSEDIPVDGFCENMSKTVPTQKLVEGVSVEL